MKLKEKYKTKREFSPFMLLLFIVFVAYTLILLGLLVWALVSSLKGRREFQTSPYGFPKELLFENYKDALELFKMQIREETGLRYVYFGELVKNSLLYAVGSAFFQTLSISITAYCCAKYRYKFSKLIYTVVLIMMMMPVVGTLSSSIQIAQALNIYGTMGGIWIMNASFLGIYFLVFYDVFASIPKAVFEAARIDGANDLQLIRHIAFPLAAKTFMIVFLINFITYWNDYQTPIIYLKTKPVIAYALFNITQTVRGNAPLILCAAIIVLVPIIVLFCCTSKYLMGNLTTGGVKE
jgi:alpha-1,4-digalacturonate transport system permease protein